MTPLPVLTEALNACLQDAFDESPRLIARWCDRLVDALYSHAMLAQASVEKHQLHEALIALKKHKPFIEQDFPAALSRAVMTDLRAGAAGRTEAPSRSFSTLSFDELELMGDSQIQYTIDNARVHQITRLACESGLSELSARLSTVQGFAVVKADRNPLRPEIYSQTLIKVLQSLSADHAAHSRWLVHGAQLLGDELQALYMMLGGQLARAGIAPAAYTVMPTPDDKTSKADAGGQSRVADKNSAAAGSPVHAGIGSVLTLDHLHRLLVGDYDDSFDPGSALRDFENASAGRTGFSHTVPAAMELLVELKEKGLPAASRGQPDGHPAMQHGSLLPAQAAAHVEQVRTRLKTEAKSLGQSLAIEVVGLMMAQMSGDSRVLPPVRAFIASVEPAYLALAVADPRFFSDKAHPARRLLEAITGKSLAYASEAAPGFAQFMAQLDGMSSALQDADHYDASTFAHLLELFEQLQARQAAETAEAQRRAVQALLQAEQRNLLADKIAAEIRVRPDFRSDSRIITAFLTGPWAQVMANERLLGEHGGLGSRKAVFSLTLGDLLWSINTEEAAQHRKRLVRIIPDMLKSIREGLLSIDYPLAQSKDFFDELMDIHQEAFKPSAAKAERRNRLEQQFAAGDEEKSPHWLAPTEAQDSGFMDDLGAGTQPAQIGPDSGPPLEASEAGADVIDSMQLKLGDWVELLSDTQWLRAQLTWISPYYTLFMFTSDGGRQHSMTSRVLQHLLQIGLVKIISQGGVLDGALDSVARTAVHNSVSRKEPD